MARYLCEELIDEIFLRLPPKSFLKFRSLSRSWCSRIDSHEFIRLHARRSVKDSQKLLIRHQICYKKNDIEDLYTLHSEDQLPLCETSEYMNIKGVKFPSGNLDIVGSCNGVICLLDSEKHISLWNPSIRREITLPEPPCCKDTTRGVHLAVGVGFDPNSDDYKIVMISYYKHVDSRGIGNPMVYSMKTGAWCEVASPTTPFYSVKSRACFVNGALHWLVKSYLGIADDDDDDEESDEEFYHRYILTFDLTSQCFGTIELPEPNRVARQLMVIKGCLAVVSREGNNNWIWMREYDDDTSCWSKVYNLTNLQCDGRVDRVLPLTNGDFLFNTCSKEFFGCKVYNASRGERSILAELTSRSYEVDMEMYVESLALLDKGREYKEKQPVCVQPKRRSRKRKMCREYQSVCVQPKWSRKRKMWEYQPVRVQQKRRSRKR